MFKHLRLPQFCVLTCLVLALGGCGGDGGSAGTGDEESPAQTQDDSDASVPEGESHPSGSKAHADASVEMQAGDASTLPPVDEGDAGSLTADGAAPVGPSVLSTLPANGATGVRADAVFVFQFSSRMDAAATEGAYVSIELPTEAVNFTWNDGGDTLTIIPKQPLPYSAGDASVGAFGFNMRITNGATDAEGQPLAEDVTLSFSTLRRITHHAARVASLSGRVNGSGASSTSVLLAGDTATNVQAVGLMSFSLDGLETDVELESAKISVDETSVVGAPDAKLGQLAAHHVSFATFGADAFSAETLGAMSVSRTKALASTPARRAMVITSWLRDDLDNRVARGDRSQVRLIYPTASNADGIADYVNLDRLTATLEVVYLAE